MMYPVVSVIMSVYNGEKYLRKSVESILHQEFKDFEFIIVDDGSTDGTQDILNSFQDKRIFVICQKNSGLTNALNNGIARAKGKYIARQDADDISKPDRLSKQVSFMEKNPSVGLLGSRFEGINENDEVTRTALLPLDDLAIRQKLYFTNQFCHSSVMIRKEILSTTGLFRDFFKYAQDYDLWLRLAEKSEIRNLPEPLVYYREFEEAISSQKILLQSLYAGVAVEMSRQRAATNTDDLEQGEIPNLPPVQKLSGNLHKKLTTFYRSNPQKLLDGLQTETLGSDFNFVLQLLCDELGDEKVVFFENNPEIKQIYLKLDNTKLGIVSTDPVISAIICTYNRADLLPKAIESLLKQSLAKSEFEIIIVDNASSDDTKSVYNRFSFQTNLSYVYESVSGLSIARNRGLAEAKGKYVAFMDDDAVASPNWLELLVHAFEFSQPTPASVGGRILPIWEIPKPDWLPDDMTRCLTILNHGEQPRYIEYPQILYGTNMAFKKEDLLGLGGFRTDIGRNKSSLLSCEEADIYLKFTKHHMPIYYLPEASVEHFVPATRLTKKWHYRRYYWQGRSEVLLHSDTFTFRTVLEELIAAIKLIYHDIIVLAFKHSDQPKSQHQFRQLTSMYKQWGKINQIILKLLSFIQQFPA